MWKIIVGFIVFAAIGMWVIIKGGDKVDMSGEKHGADAVHAPEAPASAASAPLPGVLNAPAKAASDLAAAAAVAASATASAAK